MTQSSQLSLTAVACTIVATSIIISFRFKQDSSSNKKNVLDETKNSKKDSFDISSPEETLQLLQKRRSIFPKQYTGRKVPRTLIMDMLEAARWAPTHKLTQPWKFILHESEEAKELYAQFISNHYKATSMAKNVFKEKKYEKKLHSARTSSCVIAICAMVPKFQEDGSFKGNPEVEEICSVAMAVQNMHLMATAHNLGCYWSSSGIYDSKSERYLTNPQALRDFLKLEEYENSDSMCLCLGWLYVGEFEETKGLKKWPKGQRVPLEDGKKFIWR